jgi:hypothetical protein
LRSSDWGGARHLRRALSIGLRVLYPTLPIAIASGYDDADLRQHFANDPHIGFIGKPYSREQLQSLVTRLRRPDQA